MKNTYTLTKLQMAYLPVTLRNQNDDASCMLCWSSNCGCNSDKIENDPFINPLELTTEELKYA